MSLGPGRVSCRELLCGGGGGGWGVGGGGGGYNGTKNRIRVIRRVTCSER